MKGFVELTKKEQYEINGGFGPISAAFVIVAAGISSLFGGYLFGKCCG